MFQSVDASTGTEASARMTSIAIRAVQNEIPCVRLASRASHAAYEGPHWLMVILDWPPPWHLEVFRSS